MVPSYRYLPGNTHFLCLHRACSLLAVSSVPASDTVSTELKVRRQKLALPLELSTVGQDPLYDKLEQECDVCHRHAPHMHTHTASMPCFAHCTKNVQYSTKQSCWEADTKGMNIMILHAQS